MTSEPTIDRAVGELSDEELVKSMYCFWTRTVLQPNGDCVLERINNEGVVVATFRIPLAERHAIIRDLDLPEPPDIATEWPAAMPEPTPDRAVGELIGSAREVAVSAWTLYSDDDRCGTDADYDAFTDAVESALNAATERPADTVTIRWETAFRAYSWLAYLDETFLTDEDDTAIEELEAVITADEHRAALSAAGDGGDCG